MQRDRPRPFQLLKAVFELLSLAFELTYAFSHIDLPPEN
jgi:hypothetical protein